MRKNYQSKNVFCIEGIWDENNLKDQSTIEPVLALLNKYLSIKYIYKNCITKKGLEYLLQKWSLKKYEDYPILYLAFHGDEFCINLVDGKMELDEISEILKEKCKNRVIIFSSCSTLNVDTRKLKKFKNTIQALALCGYKTEVDWLKSTVCDLLILEALQEYEFSLRGLKGINKRLNEISKKFKELEFIIVYE